MNKKQSGLAERRVGTGICRANCAVEITYGRLLARSAR